jgi:hypothetical protein
MASGDIGTAFYSNININNYYCASNKLYEYIAMGKPVITNDYPGLLERVERFGQGICLKEITLSNLAKAFGRASDSLSISPGTKRYFWDQHEYVLSDLYNCRVSRTGISPQNVGLCRPVG